MDLLLFRFLKFGIVGFSGLLIDFGVTYLLKEKVKIHKYISNTCGFITAATTNYFLNRTWTFHSNNSDIVMEYSSFIIVSIIGLSINSLIIWLFTSKFRYNFYFSKLIAIGITIIWNFVANLYFTFHSIQ